MQKFYFILSLFIITALISGCGGQVAGAKSLEDYRMATDVPSATSITQTAQVEVAGRTPPGKCPVTTAESSSFQAPEPYSPDAPWDGEFWYGSNDLWVALGSDGVWSGLPDNPKGYTQKIPWWREGSVWDEEPLPPLVVTGERLDGEAPPLNASAANGSYAVDMGSAMMMGVDFPTLGCWKITGKYQNDELSFVVWVAP